jgi:chromosome segregation ATPase
MGVINGDHDSRIAAAESRLAALESDMEATHDRLDKVDEALMRKRKAIAELKDTQTRHDVILEVLAENKATLNRILVALVVALLLTVGSTLWSSVRTVERVDAIHRSGGHH